MAEDVEIIGEETGTEDGVNVEVIMSPVTIHPSTSNNDVSSTDSSTDIIIDVVSTAECQPPDLVSSVSDVRVSGSSHIITESPTQTCDCSIQGVHTPQVMGSSIPRQTSPVITITAEASSSVSATPTKTTRLYCASSSCEIVDNHRCTSRCNSEYDCDIIVDDSPLGDEGCKDVIVTEASMNDMEDVKSSTEPLSVGNSGNVDLRYSRRLSRSVTPCPSFGRLTPSTPGTPRQRSGSVTGTTYASPSPRPSTRGNTPGERQRAGSMGELEMRERNGSREVRQGVRIIDNLDILQLPRPRNPGGVLPQNGHSSDHSGNEALDLIMNLRTTAKRKTNGEPLHPGSSYTSFLSSNVASTSAASITTSANTSYLISNIIRTTPNKHIKSSNVHSAADAVQYVAPANNLRGWASSINELVERPQPSSVVDSEGVAKKIARLDNQLCSSSMESLWGGRMNSQPDNSSFRGLRGVTDRTPPERPKPPRRGLSPMPDNSNIDVSGDRFISPSRRRRLSPVSSAMSHLHSSMHTQGEEESLYSISPEVDVSQFPSSTRFYKCRLCNFTSSTYLVLQQHILKHGENMKMFKCPLCDFSTTEKAQFRRHRRLHNKSAPVNVLRCGKCSFSSTLPRKMRDHYHQIHHEIGTPGMSSELTDSNIYPPQRYMGSRATAAENVTSYPGHFYDGSNLDGILLNRNDRVGFSYPSSGRQPPLDYSLDQYNMPYGDIRSRQDENLASSYLRMRSIVTSIMNSEANSRQSATSTITSSSYFVPSAGDSSHQIPNIDTCNTHNCKNTNCSAQHSTEVKIKIEPDLDEASDISSTANSCNATTPDMTRLSTDNRSQPYSDINNAANVGTFSNTNGDSYNIHRPTRHRSLDAALLSASRNNHISPLRNTRFSHDLPTDLTSPRKAESETHPVIDTAPRQNADLENGSDNHSSFNSSSLSNTIVKSDTTTRGVQCVLPLIKTEMDLDGDYYDFFGSHRFRFSGVDRAVQCDLFSTSSPNTNTGSKPKERASNRTQSISESEVSEHHSSVGGESRCEHCGISFEDEVIYSIHIGCHSHTDPFKCNVCGKQCGNKYGFYSHIMRGHQF